MDNIWEELNSIDEDWLLEMSNIRGKFVKVEDIDFSFYFSAKNSNHGIRVKIRWDREKLGTDFDGYLELHGDYKWNPVTHSKKVKQYEIDTARYFFKRYKSLFAAVWELKLDENILIEYLKGQIPLHDLIKEFENISQKDIDKMLECNTTTELNKCVRENDIFNMND